MTSLNFAPHVSYFTCELCTRMSSEDEPLENLLSEETEVDCTSGSDSSEQQHLLTHPRAKSKCW